MDEKLLTAHEAAQLKGVSRTAVYNAVADGRLPHVRILGRVGLREADVLAWDPIRYGGRPGAKGRGGRPLGMPVSAETRARLSAIQKARWAKHKAA